MKNSFLSSLLVLCLAMICSCSSKKTEKATFEAKPAKYPVLFDTDANNELDDQHALAYLLLNGNTFDVVGITVNATRNGGDIQGHYDEARRVMQLCTFEDGEIPLLKGANGEFHEIVETVSEPGFDGREAVDFIIEEAMEERDQKLVLLPVGKLTNIALALKKKPAIADRVRIVWLGSNYPAPGEYNQVNDTSSMSYILETDVPFEMVTVRYGDLTGTAAVLVTQEEINERMPGKGPRASGPVVGRHGVAYETFGDYSVNLFEHIDYHGDPPARSMFDLVAVAIVKNPDWGEVKEIPCPVYINNEWIEQPDNPRKILVWENFDGKSVMDDFYSTLDNYVFVNR
jgi:inosine-uridine nucleoside N-ribohydrolase